MTDILSVSEKVSSRFGVGVDTEFLPLGYVPDTEPNNDKVALDARTKIDLLKSFIDDVSSAEASAREDSFLSKQSHLADLTWISKELRGALMSHGNSEYAHAVVIGRIQVLASALDKRIMEM